MCTDLVASDDFPVQLLMYCNDNNIFGGELGIFFGGGGGWGSLYTLNILV